MMKEQTRKNGKQKGRNIIVKLSWGVSHYGPIESSFFDAKITKDGCYKEFLDLNGSSNKVQISLSMETVK